MKRIRIHKQLNRSHFGNFSIFFGLVAVGAFMALPLYLSIVTSLKPPEELFIFPPRFYVVNPTGKNFTELFQLVTDTVVPLSRYLFNSIFVSIATTTFGVIIGAMAAYPFAKLFSGGVTALPAYIIKAKLGLIDTYWVLILPHMASTLHMFLMRQFMLQIPDVLLDAAKIDGAGDMRIFYHVVLPNIKPAWMTVMVLTFMAIWNTGSAGVIWSEPLKLLPTALSQITVAAISRTGVAAASSVLLMLPPIISFVVTQSKMLQTMAHSGIKD